MPWTEAQVDELINNVRRDFALERMKSEVWQKLRNRGISLRVAEKAISKKSYIVEYEHHGPRIGFLDPKNLVFVVWKSDYPSELKTCFIAEGGVDYLKRQYDFQFIWIPK
jgi:hypothetical protein